MRILVLEPEKVPYEKEIEHDIEAMQSIVEGYIEPIYFEPKGDAIAWCNEEFLLRDFKPNRIIGNTIVHGTCFITGDGFNEYGERDACSLSDEQVEEYTKRFWGYLVPVTILSEEPEESQEPELSM